MGNSESGPCRCAELERAPADSPVRKTRAVQLQDPTGIGADALARTAPWYEKMCESRVSQNLFHAAVIGDSKATMAALVSHASPNCCNADGLTPLVCAVAGGHVDVTRLLVTSGAKVNAVPSSFGISPLSLAAAQGQVEILQILLGWKADPNSNNVGGNAPLARAAEAGFCEVCRLLLEAGAQPDARDEAGATALMRAISSERLEAAQMLIRSGAPVSSVDLCSRSALSLVIDIQLRLEPLGKMALSGMINPHSQEVYWSQLSSILVEQRADVNIVGSDGDTLLSRATRNRRNDVVVRLLESKCDPDFPTPACDGGSALLVAAMNRDANLCQTLVMRAASVNMATQTGMTPLLAAVDAGDEDICFYLLQSGAKYDLRDPRTREPLVVKAAARGLRRLYDYLRPRVDLLAVTDVSTAAEELDDHNAEYEYVSDVSED